ncbi:hypothetical protein D3C79_924010 [compost metagenome]
MRALDERWQQAHQPPGQGCLVEQRHFGDFATAKHAAVELPHKATGQLHIDCSGDAAAALVIFQRIFSQGQLEPLGDAIALHQGNFVFQRRQRVATHPAHYQATQVVEAVAVDDHEARVEMGGVEHRKVSGGADG